MMTKTIKLKHSIMVKVKDDMGQSREISVNEITLQRMKAKHLKLLPASFFETKGLSMPDALNLIAGLANLPIESVDEIDVLEDLPHVSEELTSFLSLSPEIGKK
jgi:hypothetical protein